MTKIKLNLNQISDIQLFCAIAGKIYCDIDATTDDKKYIVDAKSIMGLYSLDLSRPIVIILHTDDDLIIDKFLMNCKEWIVKK